MKILFLIGALLSAVLLTVPPMIRLCAKTQTSPPVYEPVCTVPAEAPDTAAVTEVIETAAAETASVTEDMRDTVPQETTDAAAETGISAETAPAVKEAGRFTDEKVSSAPKNRSREGYDSRTQMQITGHDGGTYAVSLRDYLIGVVMAEMPYTFHEEALRAQAVAARSYLLYRAERGYAVYDYGSSCTAYFTDERAREFFGSLYDDVKQKITAAVDDTDGQVLYYDGQVCCAAYHSMSYTCTEDAVAVWGGDTPYLTSVPTPESAFMSGMTTEVRFDEAALCARLGVRAVLPMQIAYTDAGRAAAVTTASGDVFSGESFRSLLGLRSASFAVYKDGEQSVLLTVRGYGHGVGMSQYGADLYAQAGWNYKKILSHYYTSAVVGLMP